MADIVDINDFLEAGLEKKKEEIKAMNIFSESFWKLDAKLDEADEVFTNEAMELLAQLEAGSPQAHSLLKMMGIFQFLLLVAREKSLQGEMNYILFDQTIKRVAD